MKTIKTLTAIALTAVLAFVISGCSSDGGDDPVLPLPPAHVHAYSDSWTSSETHHWHAATCGHTDQVKDKAEHDFPETWTEVTAATEEADGLEERFCSVCEYRETRIILMLGHNHNVDRNNWTSDETNHWHAADCGRPAHNEDFAPHTEDNGTITKAPTCTEKGLRTYKCTVCDKVRTEEIAVTGHTEDNGTITSAPTCTEKGLRIYKCTVCGEELRTEEIPELYSSPVDAGTGQAATKSSKYIYFGVFPKTVLPKGSTVIVDETISVKMGADTYYKGSDGEYYAKVMENECNGSASEYSDGTQVEMKSSNSYRYFKVEPIKWKVITNSYSGKCLLLAEDILTANIPYYSDTQYRVIAFTNEYVYPSNYKYSAIRAYLNGKYESYDTQLKPYENKGFLQTAFTAEAQNLIAVTTVDNSSASTTDSGNNVAEATEYVCEDTKDKIFLLSLKEATSYGFPAYNKSGAGNARIRKPTDYAKANNAFDGYGGYWWLRTPYSGTVARDVKYDGSAGDFISVDVTYFGVVPALSISLQ